MRKIALSLAVTAALATAVAVAPAAAAKGVGGGGGGKPKPAPGSTTVALVLLNSTDGLPHWGQHVTFQVTTTQTPQPWVHLTCNVGGALVAEGWQGMFAGALGDGTFALDSPKWTGGAADCTATVTNPSWAPLGSTAFHVYA